MRSFVDHPDRRGFSVHGLAVIVGNSGDLSNYPGPAALWKRLGWAPADEYETGEKSDGRKVPRARKGRIYGVIVPQIIKAQVRRVKDDDGRKTDESVAIGPYGAVYLETKARLLERFTAEGGKAPKWHASNLAYRVMLKALLRDLWCAWRDEDVGEASEQMPTSSGLPPSARRKSEKD